MNGTVVEAVDVEILISTLGMVASGWEWNNILYYSDYAKGFWFTLITDFYCLKIKISLSQVLLFVFAKEKRLW